jgi:hypothetical protein
MCLCLYIGMCVTNFFVIAKRILGNGEMVLQRKINQTGHTPNAANDGRLKRFRAVKVRQTVGQQTEHFRHVKQRGDTRKNRDRFRLWSFHNTALELKRTDWQASN